MENPKSKPQGDNYQRRSKDAVVFPKTVRAPARAMNTSARAGVTMPGGFIPLAPGDSVKSGSRARIMVQMEETEKMLTNATILRAHAHFVSYAALDRFDGLDSVAFGWAERVGAQPIVQTHTYAAATHLDFYKAFGEHIQEGENINDVYLESYNQVINFRRQTVSKSLDLRTPLQATLARALWGDTALSRIVPDFDAAMIDASVQLQYAGTSLPVNLTEVPVTGYRTKAVADDGTGVRSDETGTVVGGGAATHRVTVPDGADSSPYPLQADLTGLVAELTGNAGAISLAALAQAEKVKAFAQMRARMAGTADDLINLLMRGISIPRGAYHDPILMGSGVTTIGQMQRYATDAANLDQYVANGAGVLDIPIILPEQDTGGVVVITYEIVPEPVFDRQGDMFLRSTFAELPNNLRDYLDTQPVKVVPNRFVDSLHTSPDGTFGYAPMNFDWSQRRIGMGGRYYRDLASTASDEDQQHVWSVRTVDPVLDQDAFLVPSNLAHNVFQDTLNDPFIVRVEYDTAIEGMTQFGPALYESTGDYAAVVAFVPTDTIAPPSSA